MKFFEEWKFVIAMVMVDFGLAVVNILLKKLLTVGIPHLLIITYRQTISTIFLAPVSYLYERKSRPRITARVLCQLFISAIVGVTLSQYFFLIGLKNTSATFTCAFINMVPVNTFLMALPFGLEKLNIRKKSGRAKVLGTLISISGVIILTLYKGTAVTNVDSVTQNQNQHRLSGKDKSRWIIGSLFLTAGSLMWSSWFLIQSKVSKNYPSQYSSTAMLTFFSSIQSALLYLVLSETARTSMSAWIIKDKWDILSVIYSGIVGSGICYVGMSWCVKRRGPVFTSAFSPFIQIFVAVFDVSFLHEQIYLGSVLGSVLVIGGMYILLWGKSKEADEAYKQNNSITTTTTAAAASPPDSCLKDGTDESNNHHQIVITPRFA